MNTRWGGYLDRIDEFDNHFFGISDREAARIDPQQRILLELAWEALEDAGLPPAGLRGSRTGVFIGIAMSEYGMMLSADRGQTDGYAAAGTALCMASNRLSFTFGLQGPSLSLDTACSSALVALHLACQNIRAGECEAALAGGVNLLLSPAGTIHLTKAGFSASDGRVRAFDAAATGYVRSDGAGLVMLKPLTAALRDNDPIHAVILGSAVNQNGTSNGLTAPSRPAQELVLREAYSRAKVSPGLVQYVETQGTGTRLGDAMEAMALGNVLRDGRAADSRCAIGSVKTNLGHMEAASGIGSVMKAALALERRRLPPSLHFQTPSPDIPFDRLPLRVVRELEPWPDSAGPKLAGVSAFGFGGSNVHVVLQEAPAAADGAKSAPAPRVCLLPLSARTEKALEALARCYVEFLRKDPPAWRDVSYTAACRREHHDCRLAVLAGSAAEALDLLQAKVLASAGGTDVDESANSSRPAVFHGRKPFGRDLKTAFLYDGCVENLGPCLGRHAAIIQGPRAELEEIDAVLQRVLGWSLESVQIGEGRCGNPEYALPAILALQLAWTAWWRSAGIAPAVVLGRGVGELAAACCAGILAPEEALRIAACAHRGAACPSEMREGRSAALPFLSAVDGRVHPGPDLNSDHWQSCIERAAGWATAVQTIRGREVDLCLEVGPGSLTAPAALLLERESGPVPVVPSVTRSGAIEHDVQIAVGTLYVAGAEIDWKRIAPTEGRCVRVPTYPWQRQRLWAARRTTPAEAASSPVADASVEETGVSEAPRPRPDLTVPYVAPRNEMEDRIARVWQEVLRLERVGIHDNFFELGGDSLQVAILLNRLRGDLNAAVPLRDMYGAPTIARLAEWMTTAAAEGTAPCETIPRAPRDGVLLPSLTQEALWFLDQLERERPTYTIYSPLRIRGRLNVSSVERSLNEIARRHEILRTTFPEVDGRPVQAIAPFAPRPLPLVDLSSLPPSERQAELERWIFEEMGRPVNLHKGPLIRITLLRLGEEDHVAVVSTHHIIYDGWSMAVLLRELAALYFAFEAGLPSPLAELPIQYADFAAWQRQRLQGDRLATLRSYWVRQLAGVPPLELPTDYARPAVRTTRGAVRSVPLARGIGEVLAEFCRREAVTPYIVLLAALEVLLHRYSGQDDFAVGSPVANRSLPETEPLIGYFVNVVVLRSVVSGDPSFRDLLRRMREVTLAAMERQEMTLDQVVNAVNPPRDLSRHPLFQVMFALQNIELAAPNRFGLSLEPLEDGPVARSSFFDLTLELWPAGTSYRADWYFSTDLFAAETIDRMARHYESFLAAAIADPERSLSDLSALPEDERRKVVVEWNATAADYPRGRCVHELFAARAEQVPDAAAVVLDGERWTYRELNERSNRLARFLRAEGVGPEARVGICLERSPKLIMAVLAVLKAGGAYVPLDPAYMQDADERVRFMLQDAQASLVLTDSILSARIGADWAKQVLLDGRQAEEIDSEDRRNPDPAASAENLAYVLYTSGSTGRPKGVMVTHGNLLNAYFGWEKAYGLGSEVRSHLQMASFGFDVFTGDLVRALCSGGKLVICPKETMLEPEELLDLMHREQVEGAEFVPIILRNLLPYLESTGRTPESLRLAVVGSDAWHVADHRRAKQALGARTRLINSYGLTETTIDSSYFEGDVARLSDAAMVPIGRPFPNVRLYVLDGRMRPAPIGVPGELYIGGDGLSRGYVNPQLDAGRFVVDSHGPGARLLRTGDRARWRADGQVEFLGRADNQVKVRGFRVEPEEVEQVLREHPSLSQAAVAARERSPGDLRLVAYTVARPGLAPEAHELRQFLVERVPEYMVPSAFVVLPSLPETPSGKVDRKALPEPDWGLALSGRFVAPQSDTERRLAEIWEELLDVRPVGVRDPFFDLGGNSLLAMRMVSRIRTSEGFRGAVSIRDVFVHQTIAELARLLDKAEDGGQGTEDGGPGSVDVSFAAGLPWTAAGVRFAGVEREPLEDLIRTGRLAPVDSAALGYWPARLLEPVPQLKLLLDGGWFARRALLVDVRQTRWGRIADIMLPMFDSELYARADRLLAHTVEGLELAGSLGARVVSLTGLIPSATDNARAVAAALNGRDDLPRPTTGHATTAAAVFLALRRALGEAGRELAGERVAFLGLGSIGAATLRLLMSVPPHPREIILSDLFSKIEVLREIQRELVEQFAFRGPVRVLSSASGVPEKLYEATTIVGATNVPGVLEMDRVRPGTVLVDDSAPHSFQPGAAIERFETSADVLFTEGGTLKSPEAVQMFRYLPPGIETFLAPEAVKALTFYNPWQITGCVLSGLLSARFDEIRPTNGPVDRSDLCRNLEKLNELGFVGADLHCEGYVLAPEQIRRFRDRVENKT